MATATPLKPAWNAGELSPRLGARTDLNKYKNGADILENMIPLSEGGAMRRAGTRFVAEVKDSTANTRLKRFKFSTTQAYVIETGDQYFRFYKDQGRLTAGETDAAVSNGVFTDGSSLWNDESSNGSIAHSSSDGSLAFTLTSSSDTAAIEQLINVSSSLVGNEHIMKFRVIGNSGDKFNFQLGTSSSNADLVSAIDKPVGYHAVPFTPNSTEFHPQFTYQGSWRDIDVPSTASFSVTARLDDVSIISDQILELQTPYGSSQIYELEGPQSADVLRFYHNETKPHKLERRGHTNWSLVQIDHQDGPYMDVNLTDTTLTANSTDGRAITVTASDTAGINSDAGFGSSDVGRLLRISTPSTSTDNWGWGMITAVGSATSVTVDVRREIPTTSATTEWRLGSWSDETGWPGVATFHDQRLVTARSVDEPQTKWYSQTADFENHSPDSITTSSSLGEIWDGTIEDDDALTYTISSDDVEAIEWLTSGVRLQIGTRNAEWEVASDGPVIKPTDIQALRHTQYGSARIQPARVGPATLFVQRAKRRIRELVFSFEQDGLIAQDLTRLSPHITVGGMVELAYQQEPDSVVWGVREDGQLVSLTYRRDEDVVALSRHKLGGSYDSDIAAVETVTTIPGSTASGQTQDSLDRDEVWVSVKRTIDGSTKRYVEFFERDYEAGDSQEDSYYSDSILTYDSTAATALTGYTHISGETAKVFANGAVHPDVSVSSSAGTVTLDIASSTVQIGLGYTHVMKTFKLDAGSPTGTAQGKTKRVPDVTFSVLNALRMKVGASSSQLTTFDFREVSDAMDTAVPLKTTEQVVELEGDWQTDARVFLEDDAPAPFTLLAIVPTVKTNDL
jgi:hypothetical protein